MIAIATAPESGSVRAAGQVESQTGKPSAQQGVVRNPKPDVRKALGGGVRRPPLPSDGEARFLPWRCVVLDVALVVLTVVVFAVLALVLRGLERL